MDTLATVLGYILLGWAILFLCSLPILAALIRSSQLSRAEEPASEWQPETSDERKVAPAGAGARIYNKVGSLPREELASIRTH
jgi:hypothetical protein